MSSVRKHASIATIAVMGSRVAGLVREMVFAFFFGAGPALDAFIAAFRIPNLLRDLFAEGALSGAFVTVFSQKMVREGDASAWKLANKVLTFVFILIGSVAILGIIFSPVIVGSVASGFAGPKYEFTILLNRILFPFILFVSLAAVCMGMLNARGKFALPQSASTFFNITSIVAGLLFAYLFSPDFVGSTFHALFAQGDKVEPTWPQMTRALTGMAVGTLLGGLVQWVVQIPSLWKLHYRFRLTVDFKDPDFRRVLQLTVPAIIGGAAVQINVLVNTNFASYLADGSMAWLNYAFRLMQFPIGVFGVAVALATTPAIARLVAGNDTDGFTDTLRNSTALTLFLCVPSALGLMLLSEPIMALIYQHGHFSASDTVQAARALSAYAVGLAFYALIKVYQPVFLAFGDAKTPMVVSFVSIAVNAALNWVFVFVLHFEHWGLALGTSCVAMANGILLIVLLRKKVKGVWNNSLLKEAGKILGAALIAVLAGWTLYRELLFILGNQTLLQRAALVFCPMLLTGFFYYFFCVRLQVNEVGTLKNWLTRRLFS